MAQRGLREVDGFGVYLKTRLACNGLCIRNEGEKNQDKFYIWRIRNWVNSGTGEVDLEGKIKSLALAMYRLRFLLDIQMGITSKPL